MWQVKRKSSVGNKNSDGVSTSDKACPDWSCLPGPVFEMIMAHADFGRHGGARLACKSWLRSLTRGRTQLLYCLDTAQWQRKLELIQSAFGSALQHVDLVIVEGGEADRATWLSGCLATVSFNFQLLSRLPCQALSMRLYVSSPLAVPLEQLSNIRYLEIGPRVVAIDSALPALARMSNLQTLEITVFEDERELPGHWSGLLQQLTQVRHISLDIQTTSDAALCPAFTASLVDIERLKELRLACRQLPDFAGIATGLRSRALLTALRLEGQCFSPRDLQQLAELHSLRELYLVAAVCYPAQRGEEGCGCGRGPAACTTCRSCRTPAGVLPMFARLTALRHFKYTVAHRVQEGGALALAGSDECCLTDGAIATLAAAWRQLTRFHYKGFTSATSHGLAMLAGWPSEGFCVDVDPEVRRSSCPGASSRAVAVAVGGGAGPLRAFTCASQLPAFCRDMKASPLYLGS